MSKDIISRRGILLGGGVATLMSPPSAISAPSTSDASVPLGANASGIPFQLAPTGITRSVQERLGEIVSVKDFGAVGDNKEDDTAGIQRAIHFCQEHNRTLHFPPGIYTVTKTLEVTSSANRNDPISLVGENLAPMQQGSYGPAVLIRWRGGTSAILNIDRSGTVVSGIGFQNFGSATDAIHLSGGQHYHLRRLSFLPPSLPGARRFARSCIFSQNASLGYGRLETIWFASAAPKCVFIDGIGGTGGGTPLEIMGRCVIESNRTFGPTTVLHIRGEDFDAISIWGNTFNQQENAELRIVDSSDRPTAVVATTFAFYMNELDYVSTRRGDLPFQLTNFQNIMFFGNAVQGGAISSVAELVNSTVTCFHSNYAISLSGPFFLADDTSRVFAGPNQFVKESTSGFVNNAAETGIIPIKIVGGNIALIFLDQGPPTGHQVYRLSLSADRPLYLGIASETDSRRGIRTPGQVFTVEFTNKSATRLPQISPAGPWKLAGSAVPAPRPGMTIALTCVWTGSEAREIYRSEEVPN